MISPERMPLTHGCHYPPPDMPNLGIDATTFRLRDLRLARLSYPGILVCVSGFSIVGPRTVYPAYSTRHGWDVIGPCCVAVKIVAAYAYA